MYSLENPWAFRFRKSPRAEYRTTQIADKQDITTTHLFLKCLCVILMWKLLYNSCQIVRVTSKSLRNENTLRFLRRTHFGIKRCFWYKLAVRNILKTEKLLQNWETLRFTIGYAKQANSLPVYDFCNFLTWKCLNSPGCKRLRTCRVFETKFYLLNSQRRLLYS